MRMNVLNRVKALLLEECEKKSFSRDDFLLEEEYPLAKLTSFRTGGPATVLFPKTCEVLCTLVPRLLQENIEFFVLGLGSNVLALDEGYPGLILSLTQLKKVSVRENEVYAEAGASITGLALLAQKESLGGMEFFYGIPGSVGGAVFMNAGAYGGECKDILKSVTYLTREGKIVTEETKKLEMGYRTSIFEKNGAVILSAVFALEKGDPAAIRATMDDLMGRRVEKQPLEYPSAGSTFKRYPGYFSGKLIEEAGLKGYTVGGAQVSEKHAGFVINIGNATAQDVLALIDHIRKVIKDNVGIELQTEVKYIENPADK